MINYDKVWKYIQAPADFMRDGNREGIKELRPCDNKDFHDTLSQLVNLTLFPRGENKRKLKK